MDNRGPNKLLFIFSVLILAVFPASCAVVEQPGPQEASEILWHAKTPAQILEHLREKREQIKNLAAYFSLSVDPPPQGQPSHMGGIMFFSRRPDGPCVRIKGLGPFRRILFDLVQKGDDLRIYVPSKHTLFVGRIGRKKGAENVWGELFRTMFSDFSGAVASRNSPLLFRDDMVIVPLVDGEIRLDRKNGLVRQWHVGEKTVAYDLYDRKPGLPPVPMHITVSTKDGSRHAVCRLSQVDVNGDLADVFDLSAYRPKALRDLKEMSTMSGP